MYSCETGVDMAIYCTKTKCKEKNKNHKDLDIKTSKKLVESKVNLTENKCSPK